MPVSTAYALEYTLVPDDALPVAALIVAAGQSVRMGQNKQLMELCGIPVIARSMLVFQQCDAIRDVILVAREEDRADISRLAEEYGITKLTGVAAGGELRQQSVQNGLQLLAEDVAYVAIHDGARPLITGEVILRTLQAAKACGAAAPAVPVTDTLKRVNEDGIITATVPREQLMGVQTPQIFDRSRFQKAMMQLSPQTVVTDDCSIMEQAGFPVQLVAGEPSNIKITTPSDLLFARAYLEEERL